MSRRLSKVEWVSGTIGAVLLLSSLFGFVIGKYSNEYSHEIKTSNKPMEPQLYIKTKNRSDQIKDTLYSLGCRSFYAAAYSQMVDSATLRFVIPWKVVVAVMKSEVHNFNPRAKSFVATRSGGGKREYAIGIMQIKKSTFYECVRELGLDSIMYHVDDPLDNIFIGTYYLAKCKLILGPNSTDEDAVKAFKVGPGRYSRDRKAGRSTNYNCYLSYLKIYKKIGGSHEKDDS